MSGAEIERLQAPADDRFLQSSQGSNPDHFGDHPNSLLIILCHLRSASANGYRQPHATRPLPTLRTYNSRSRGSSRPVKARSLLGWARVRMLSKGRASSRAYGMNIAVSYHPAENGRRPEPRSAGKLARVEVFEDMLSAEPFWRRLEAGRALATPYQRFDLLSAWQYHVGARTGVTPFIVVGFDDAGEPLFLWPFGRTQNGPAEGRAVPRVEAREFQCRIVAARRPRGDRRARAPRRFRRPRGTRASRSTSSRC